MTTVTFHVTSVTKNATAAQLGGSTSVWPLTKLVVHTGTPTNHVILENAANAAISVSQAEFDAIPSSGTFDLVLTGTDSGTQFTVDSTSVSNPHLMRRTSDVYDLVDSDSHDQEPARAIVGELRALNRRVASIEKLLMEARDGAGEYRPTGTDPR